MYACIHARMLACILCVCAPPRICTKYKLRITACLHVLASRSFAACMSVYVCGSGSYGARHSTTIIPMRIYIQIYMRSYLYVYICMYHVHDAIHRCKRARTHTHMRSRTSMYGIVDTETCLPIPMLACLHVLVGCHLHVYVRPHSRKRGFQNGVK